MWTELYIARRFAFKQRSSSKPTFIVLAAIIGIAVGTAALILTLSVVKGFADSVEHKLISFTSHLQVRQPEDKLFQESRYDISGIRSNSNIREAYPFLEKSFVMRSRTRAGEFRSKPVILRGTPESQRTAFLAKFLVAGKAASTDAGNEIQLFPGKTLAENLGLKAGSKVLLVGLDKSSDGAKLVSGNRNIVELLSSLDLEIGTVCGIYETGLQEGFDETVVFSDLGSMQKRFSPSMISGYDANVADISKLPETVKLLSDKLGYPYYAYTVFERYANLFEWLKLQKNIMPLLIVTITIVAVFNIISTLLVLIIEKTREIGMLCALGLEPAKISRIFMAQAFLISTTGIAAGNLLALSLSLFEQRFHLIRLPEKSYFIKYAALLLDPADYAIVSCSVMALTLLFAFIPARIASSLKPGTALGT
ncbi:MAG: ABC transporter permease [Chlorobiaceae bacterium]|nr:ABC transporter permease [Chlorobiaceae bacterium]NTW10277.1 ABC transporter permease [Chlorobiaceae bacterium]